MGTIGHEPAFFEGPEKKIELTVDEGHPSLRSLGDEVWDRVVRAADATILSKKSNEAFDAYLLSESSLFVYHTFCTMITCGRTRLVEGLAAMLEHIPPEAVSCLFYERKNEHFPHEQPTSFFQDAKRIQRWLPGEALRLGTDHEHAVYLFHSMKPHVPAAEDTTIEVLMHDIHPERAQRFVGPDRPGDGELARSLGLGPILEGFELDEHVFSPAGYSLNGLRGDSYVTIHVTPERVGSYVSFETNMDFRDDPSALVRQVVEPFAPDSFDVVTFVPKGTHLDVGVHGYHLRRHIVEPASGYDITFQHFFRPVATPERAFRFRL